MMVAWWNHCAVYSNEVRRLFKYVSKNTEYFIIIV